MRNVARSVAVAAAAVLLAGCGGSGMTDQELADGYWALFGDVSSVVRATVPVHSADDFNRGAEAVELSVRAEQLDSDLHCYVDGARAMVFDPRRGLTMFSRKGCSSNMDRADVVVYGISRDGEVLDGQVLEGAAIFELMRRQQELDS